MKKVLMFLSSLNVAGEENVVMQYFNHIDKNEIKFDFFVLNDKDKGFYEDHILSFGCKVYKLQNRPRKFLQYKAEIKRYFDENHYDIVHINTSSATRYVIEKIAKKSGVKTVILHSHSASTPKPFWHQMCKGKADKWCDYRFACSEAAGKHMFNKPFVLINNAIELERFAYNLSDRLKLRERFNIGTKMVIGNVGRLTYSKNQMFLLKLIPYIKQYGEDFVIMFVGDGPDREKLDNYVQENNLADYIIFTGNVGTEVNIYYSAFDVLAFPSMYEGLSVVMIETQANGVPVIASDKISVEHKIGDNFSFLPIDETEDNREQWAKAILEKAGRRMDNKDKLIQAGYDIDTEAKKLQDFYLNL